MRMMLCEIGVLDTEGKIHKVELDEGLNIITGKSSTGKSALIEIVDYCFVSGEYTVPKGVITDNAEIYYIYLKQDNKYFVLGRHAKKHTDCYLKHEQDYQKDLINFDYFASIKAVNIKHFKGNLKNLFIGINDVDESEIAKEIKGKSPTPSIRSFMSFMLQHQNLIANKHALFYRFDEKEKRDQVIEHTKIFLGFVNQDYFVISKEKENIEYQIKSLQREKKSQEKIYEKYKNMIHPLLSSLRSLMGIDEDDFPKFHLIDTHIESFKEEIHKMICDDNINRTSDESSNYYRHLSEILEEKTHNRKILSMKRNQIKHSLNLEESISNDFNHLQKIELNNPQKDICPFCQNESDALAEHAKLLNMAIHKFNTSISENKGLKAELQLALKDVEKEISTLNHEIKETENLMRKIKENNQLIQQNMATLENILNIKSNLFSILDIINLKNHTDLDNQIEQLKAIYKELENKLNIYNISNNINKANHRVNEIMSQIGRNFDFEDSYRPIKLKFSFENFNLYHKTTNGEKIYLRSMGSGANWLYSHLTLFLALHQYFIELDNHASDGLLKQECLIPSILMIDQPTQVYFPNFKFDTSAEFDEKKIKKLEHDPKTFDEDIQSVTNIFKQLAIYCHDLKQKFGYSPQIIITDHVDGLNLGEFNFEDFVKARWRKRGFIKE